MKIMEGEKLDLGMDLIKDQDLYYEIYGNNIIYDRLPKKLNIEKCEWLKKSSLIEEKKEDTFQQVSVFEPATVYIPDTYEEEEYD